MDTLTVEARTAMVGRGGAAWHSGLRSGVIALTLLATRGCLGRSPTAPPIDGLTATAAISPVAPSASLTPLPLTAAPEATATPIPLIAVDLPLSDLSYAIPLTVRHVTNSSATLFFELEAPSVGRMLVQPEDGAAVAIELPIDPSSLRWLWTVEGLTPANRYRVVVALEPAGEPAQQPRFRSREWGPVTFRTAPDSGVVRIGVIGDASFGDLATFDLVRQMAASDLDFVLHAGDVVDETEVGGDPFDSYAEKFFAPFEPLLTQMPVYTIPGNHDYDTDIRFRGAPFYDHVFPPFPDLSFPGQEERERNQYYAFARSGFQFVMLDSQVFFGVDGLEEQTGWLKERLSDPRFKATIPVVHVAPFSSSSVHPTNSLPVRRGWVPLFAAARVPLVFSGHFHQYERLAAHGITYIVTGGGSSTLYAPGEWLPESLRFARSTHFVLMELDGDRIRLKAIALGGEILDQTEIVLPPTAS